MQDQRQVARTIFAHALTAVEPAQLIKRVIGIDGYTLHCVNEIVDLQAFNNIYVIGAGKASVPMAAAMEEIIDAKISKGAITTKYGHATPLQCIVTTEAGHPVPDENGLKGTETIKSILESATENDLVIMLLSGGGSALLADIPLGCTLSDIQQCNELLLQSGADIVEINTVRKHLSNVKGGQLARIAYPAKVVTLILSDVLGDPLNVIASGPTVPDPTTFADAWKVLEKYNLLNKIPDSVLAYLTEGKTGTHQETPKPGDRIFERVSNYIIGSNRLALAFAREKAEELGYIVEIYSNQLQGEAREVAKMIISQAKEVYKDITKPKPYCILAGGETTVTIRGNGLGGRNQELALAAAIELEHQAGITLLSAGTDGTDGPTDATGALADSATLFEAIELGIDGNVYLKNNDSYHFFQQVGGHLITGPTQTNVMDLIVVLIHA
ncbi:glycerate kinase [Cytophagaceae bacterium DM2B3-1]|uniref:Glycerate kinase n=1 Tax=Xanthocytophaga flava TaxID=3048013 RepID=A0ABT7CGB1_9BACT|nr:glycerate kinase [Xanthocytophaga flavus]MDJ1492780.1 glycerate kinase [Xanthocytophaga flavus]